MTSLIVASLSLSSSELCVTYWWNPVLATLEINMKRAEIYPIFLRVGVPSKYYLLYGIPKI